MQKFFLITIMTFSVISCSKNENEDFVKIAGKVENARYDSVFITGNGIRKGIPLKNGEFRDTLNLKKVGYYEFFGGNERTQIFINPGDSLHISVDTQEFDESLKYGGTSANENNYLAQKYLKEEALNADPKSLYSLSANDFTTKLTELKTQSEKSLEEAQVKENFKKLEEKNIRYSYLLSLDQYPEIHEYFTGTVAELPSEASKELEGIDLDSEKDFVEIPNYKNLVMQKVMSKIDKAKSAGEVEKIISSIKSQKIKDEALRGVYYMISASDPESEKYNEIIGKYGKDEKLLKRASEKTDAVRTLLPGKPSPLFVYNDINGKAVKLNDLKGKLVYIDVWATWCGPCLGEIPSLKQLESDYHGKNIEFVSISIDTKKDFEKWRKMVKEKDLKGIQLFADNDWKSEFVRAYAIDAIPRFLLIDESGNIISADAPRPSDAKIRTLIDENI